ncbi:hypothetical protein [Paenibacillus sp. FSL R5-0908]|uniref:hypothetical protein n=1 Tax=Paenibacillus sp. FSL R5-0908 TaxID=2921664 RepID=UPI0030FC6BBC
MSYQQELDALQRWIWSVASLKSYRLAEAPPKIARPAIVWEAPDRSQDRNLSRWQYVNKVKQYGKLYVTKLDQLIDLQDLLGMDLSEEDRTRGKYINQLPVYEHTGADAVIIGQLREVYIIFGNGESMDTPMRVEYEVTYRRNQTIAPPPTEVFTKVVMPGLLP